MRKIVVTLLVVALLLIPTAVAQAATTDTVTVTATPSYISISNAPPTYDFSVVTEGVAANTTNGEFTITNGSSLTIDISIQLADNWTSGGTPWTYGAPAADTAQLKASSANGGATGSTGAGDFDITLLITGASEMFMDGVSSATNPTWELSLDTPSSFTHGDAQSADVKLTAVAA